MLESGRFIFGPNVKAFEEEAAAYLGVPHAIGVANGTDALVLVLDAMGIGAGDEVICPSFTFYATAEAIARARRDAGLRRHRPGDAQPRSRGRRAPDHAADEGDHARAPLRPARRRSRELAALGLPLIEDAAQAFGAAGHRDHGLASTFSFFPTKNLFALGDGGLVAATDDERRGAHPDAPLPRLPRQDDVRADRLQLAARRAPGRGLRIFLPHLDGWNAARREAAARYAELGLGELSSCPPTSRATSTTCIVVRSPERDRIVAALAEAEIASAAYYVTPLHLQPALRYLGWERGSLPETESAARENLALPLWAGIDAEEQERVVATVLRRRGVASARA